MPSFESPGGGVALPGGREPRSCRWILLQGLEARRLEGQEGVRGGCWAGYIEFDRMSWSIKNIAPIGQELKYWQSG